MNIDNEILARIIRSIEEGKKYLPVPETDDAVRAREATVARYGAIPTDKEWKEAVESGVFKDDDDGVKKS
jgi:hypothetical protein